MLREALPMVKTPLPGPKAAAIIARRGNAIPAGIKCNYPCVIKRGEGAMFEDVDGNIFADWVGGVGVLNIGYSHPEVVETVRDQAGKYFHAMQNIVVHEGFVSLAEKLNSIVPVRGDEKRTMFANSGAEAVENAVKVARGYTKRPNVIVFSGAFHGRTLLTMTMTSKKSYAVGMGPFPDGIYRAEFPNMYRKPEGMTDDEAVDFYIKKLETVFEEASPAGYVAAVVLEPIQGEGGFVPAPIKWVQALRKLCDEKGILIIADEIQCGFCRSGKMFASEYWKEAGAEPDIISMAKSIAGGIPISAVTARKEIFDGVPAGTLGGTYGGNALACASALKIIEIMERDHLADRSLELSSKLSKAFLGWKDKYEVVGDVRGVGCMMGIEFVVSKASKTPFPELVSTIVSEAAQMGLVLEAAGTFGNVIRVLAPLVITDAQVDASLAIYEKAIEKAIAKCVK